MSAQTLSDELKKAFNISKVYNKYSGGQKTVYIVDIDGNKYAFKIYNSFCERDVRELDILNKFQHINGISKIHRIEKYGSDTIVLENFVDGKCLHDIQASYTRDGKRIAQLIFDICGIMNPIWKERIIHRDLKPTNIIIQDNDKPVVLDFGIARNPENSTITETDFQPNTWKFAAPEQLLAIKEDISYRTDFFSMAVIAHFLYYQELPFGQNKSEIIEKFRRNEAYIPCDEDCILNVFLQQSLKVHVSERPRNVDLFIKELNV